MTQTEKPVASGTFERWASRLPTRSMRWPSTSRHSGSRSASTSPWAAAPGGSRSRRADAATTIALIRAHDGLTAGVETGIRLTTPDADALHEDFLAHGVDADDVLRWPGTPPMFAFRDQDGNGLEIIEMQAR